MINLNISAINMRLRAGTTQTVQVHFSGFDERHTVNINGYLPITKEEYDSNSEHNATVSLLRQKISEKIVEGVLNIEVVAVNTKYRNGEKSSVQIHYNGFDGQRSLNSNGYISVDPESVPEDDSNETMVALVRDKLAELILEEKEKEE